MRQDSDCKVDICKNDRICLKCQTIANSFQTNWEYNQISRSHTEWKSHSEKKFIKPDEPIVEPVKMRIQDFSRNGVLKLKFNQKLFLPDFVQNDNKKRFLVDLKKLNVREDIIDVQLISKSLTIPKYTLKVKKWTQTGMEIKFDFEEPL